MQYDREHMLTSMDYPKTELEADIATICSAIREATHPIAAAYENFEAREEEEVGPVVLIDALLQLCDILKKIDAETDAGNRAHGGARPALLTSGELSELGNYGFNLLADIGNWASTLGLAHDGQQLNDQVLPLAIWLVRRGGELRTLETVVDALAAYANSIQSPEVLEDLSHLMGEIIEAVTPAIKQDLEGVNPTRPWRILNLNRGIVATRSHNPAVMEEAFQTLVRNLPEDAPAFFNEGMVQMEELDYPQPVRDVMQKYFQEWSARTLH